MDFPPTTRWTRQSLWQLPIPLFFGAMFGDVGQGLLLAIGGLILYKVKNMDLAAIIGCAGVFSTIFGFMYGSFFWI